MSLTFELIDPINSERWSNLATSHYSDNFFYSRNWAEAICKSYHYKPNYIILYQNSHIVGLIPIMEVKSIITGTRGVSLPFTDYCSPILRNGCSPVSVRKELIKYAAKKGWRYIEFRGKTELLNNSDPSCFYYGHTLKLNRNIEKLKAKCRGSTRRNVKKAKKMGVVCEIDRSYQSIKSFYRLNCETRKFHCLPPQPFYFFKNLYNSVLKQKLGIVVLAYYREKVIAGAVCLNFGNKAIYKYGASDKSYNNLRGNNAVMWNAIKWYAKKGYRVFDMGRTEPHNPGLQQYKNGWGTSMNIIEYYKYDIKKNKIVKMNPEIPRLFQKLFSASPIFLLRALGNLAYRHIG